MIKVSIVVPIYNVENYLGECLNSLINQTLDDIEILCIDDGSTDSSLEIVKDYCRKDSRIKWKTKTNSGYGNSMNVGFKMATGEYVGIVESDDYVEPDMFECLYNTAIEKNCDVVKSNYYEFKTSDYKNQKLMITPTDTKYYDTIINADSCPSVFHFKMNTWTGIYRKKFIDENNIVHNETPGAAYQDNGFWFQTLTLSKRTVFINRAFYHYRQDNPNSSINSKGKVFCMCEEYQFIENFLKTTDRYEKLIGTFLVKKYFNYMYTYKRISEEYKLPFLERFSCEFKQSQQQGYITKERLGSYVFEMVSRIMKNPHQFYYEDSIYDVQHRLIDKMVWLDNYYNSKKLRRWK